MAVDGVPQVATVAVAGTRTGSDLVLDLDLVSISTFGPALTAQFDLSVTVDTLEGQFIYDYGDDVADCALDRDE